MAAKTPDSILTENTGSSTMHIATFSTNDIDDGDTWTSGIPSVIGFWAHATDDPTITKESIDVGQSAGVFTFYTGEANRQGILYVLSKS